MARPVLAQNTVPRAQKCSKRAERSERCSEHSGTCRGICSQDQHAQAQYWPEHADLGYISCCCVGCHHSKPKSKLTFPDFNTLTYFWRFGLILTDLGLMLSTLAKCSKQSEAKHVPNVPDFPNVTNANVVPVQRSLIV